MGYCNLTSIRDFVKSDETAWLKEMQTSYSKICNQNPSMEQINAWSDCYNKIKQNLSVLKDTDGFFVFEYELPREGGRRPDLVVLINTTIFIFEFKLKKDFLHADVDQARAYARDLANYHEKSLNIKVIPVLMPTKSSGLNVDYDGVILLSPDKIDDFFKSFIKVELTIDPREWVEADYAPLPSLVEAARYIFKHKDLPNIRRANSAGIPEAIAYLSKTADDAYLHKERHIALVTGVPGAGKTLLGLQFVHEVHKDPTLSQDAVFYSGNGPLVEVLRDALGNNTFVKPLRNFIKSYGLNTGKTPKEHMVVFDEAQRAWDREQVKNKHNFDASEPDMIINIADRVEGWAMFVGLIGEGQEIHIGEEAGMIQWVDALKKSPNKWIIHCPEKLAHLFKDVAEVRTNNRLDLTVTLRSYLSKDVTQWVHLLLGGEIEKAKNLTAELSKQGFDMYVTRDLEVAKLYCLARYSGCTDKRYGLIASSKDKVLPKFGIDNSYMATKVLKIGPWFNDPVNAATSCCALSKVVTEFGCQGLELDFPIVCWENDLKWVDNKWQEYSQPRARNKAHDPHQLRLNSYRVLLTRGRDGFIMFIPPVAELDSTYELFVNLGVKTNAGTIVLKSA